MVVAPVKLVLSQRQLTSSLDESNRLSKGRGSRGHVAGSIESFRQCLDACQCHHSVKSHLCWLSHPSSCCTFWHHCRLIHSWHCLARLEHCTISSLNKRCLRSYASAHSPPSQLDHSVLRNLVPEFTTRYGQNEYNMLGRRCDSELKRSVAQFEANGTGV